MEQKQIWKGKMYYLESRKESEEVNRDKVKVARKQYRGQGHYIEEILQRENLMSMD